MLFKFNTDTSVNKENKIDIKIFAINYNVLLIKNGMGGVKYSD